MDDATHRAAVGTIGTIGTIGTPVSAADIAAWNIDVAPDGRGLPAGSGDVVTGARIFAAKCASCHGAKGEGVLGDRLIGGRGTLASEAGAHGRKLLAIRDDTVRLHSPRDAL